MAREEGVDHNFNKKFSFTYNKAWLLPLEAYKCKPQQIESLQRMKAALNACKGQLNQFALAEWSKHTKFTDPSSSIIRTITKSFKIDLLTQAWCKFYECLHAYPIVLNMEEFGSLHLCEAPGAFISALNYFLSVNYPKIKWNWRASTLNPYCDGNSLDEMIYDDRLIRHTLKNWDFGLDCTGDLRKFYNHEKLVEICKGVMLVTADGSINCMKDPGEQEHHVHFLHYCEVMTALKVLGEHGNFVLKLFTMFEHETVCVMYLLNCTFKEVHVFKPCASKSGNSEVYVICLDYKSFDTKLWETLIVPYFNGQQGESVMFPLELIPPDFVQQVEECVKFFMDLQCEHINCNIKLFRTENEDVLHEIRTLKEKVASNYMQKFQITKRLSKRRRLIKSHLHS